MLKSFDARLANRMTLGSLALAPFGSQASHAFVCLSKPIAFERAFIKRLSTVGSIGILGYSCTLSQTAVCLHEVFTCKTVAKLDVNQPMVTL